MSSSPIWRGELELVESPESPSWKFTDTEAIVTRKFFGPYTTCLAERPLAGSWATGPYLGLKVTEVSVHRQKGNRGELVLTYKGGLQDPENPGPPPGQTLPDDDCSIDYQQIEIALEKHPNYAGLLDAAQLDALHAYVSATSDQDRQAFEGKIAADPALAELAAKMVNGITHYTIGVPVYKWVLYSWAMPASLTGGSFPEAPYGPLPVPAGPAWLRQGDSLQFNGRHWQLTRTWQGAPAWDSDLYPVYA